jgi:dolichol-phosphate mannosyltransferase
MFNEEGVAVLALEKVRAQLDTMGASFELICVDDGSQDSTLKAIMGAAGGDARVRPIVLSRNYGKEAALAAGLQAARGQAVVLMDSDLQHPPELIPQLLEQWQNGFDVVNAVKANRGREGISYRLMAHVFNRLMGSSANQTFQGASDFKLLDRQVVDALAGLPEKTRFFRGLVAWVGFRTTDISFNVAPRVGGETKWSTRALIRYSLRNLISFSAFPLKLVAGVGFSTLLFAGAVAIHTLYRYISGTAISGFTTVILLQLVLGGLLLTGMGVLALYLAALYAEVKGRPTFIVRKPREPATLGLPARSESDATRTASTRDSQKRLASASTKRAIK